MKRYAVVLAKCAVIFAGSVAFAAGSPDPVCVSKSAELRRGPGPQFPVSWKVGRFMPFLRLESKGAFVKVQDLEGEIHWARPKDLTTRISCVVVKSQVAMLRREPNKSAPAAEFKTVDRYTPFKKIETNLEWIHVEDEAGRQAWIHESQVWKPMKVNSITF